MTRRKLFGGAALSGLALSSVGTVAAATSLATAPAAGLTRLSLNENPLGPSPLAVEAIQNALTEIARYAADDARALEQQIADRAGLYGARRCRRARRRCGRRRSSRGNVTMPSRLSTAQEWKNSKWRGLSYVIRRGAPLNRGFNWLNFRFIA
jgi:hypothetical protein